MASGSEHTLRGDTSLPTSVSFGFSKSTKRTKLEPSASELARDATEKLENDEEEERIHTVDMKKLVGDKPSGPRKPLVIPMVNRTGLTVDSFAQDETASGGGTDTEARLALLREAEDYHESSASTSQPVANLPMILQNQIQGEVDRATDRLDVSRRPDVALESDYDSIPIEQFGLAMIRGMGWNDGDSSKASCVPQPKLRPKGLGLGANPSLAGSASAIGAPGGGENSKLIMKIGAFVMVTDGTYKGQYGKVESLYVDDARIVVKLALQSASTSISLYTVKLVDKQEYDKESKCINKAKYEHYKASRHEEFDRQHQSSEGRKQTLSNGHAKNPDRNQYQSGRASDQSKKCEVTFVERPFWIRRDLKVRIIDENYSGGKYFKQKFVIDDVVYRDVCNLRSDNGKLLEGIGQSMLETVIPRDLPAFVMVVHGEHVGEVGSLLMRNKDKGCGSVQFLRNPDVVKELSFDNICEFLGDISAYED